MHRCESSFFLARFCSHNLFHARAFVVLAFLTCNSPATAWADCSNTGDCTYIPNGTTATVVPAFNGQSYYPDCEIVTDSCGADVMVPFVNQTEWNSFVVSRESCASLAPCNPDWVVDSWSACTLACGGGTTTPTYHCELNSQPVASYICQNANPPLPTPGPVSCNTQACPIDGACGSDNGQSFSSAPWSSAPSGLCSVGPGDNGNGSGPWTWTCDGQYGGNTASCSANTATTSCTLTLPNGTDLGDYFIGSTPVDMTITYVALIGGGGGGGGGGADYAGFPVDGAPGGAGGATGVLVNWSNVVWAADGGFAGAAGNGRSPNPAGGNGGNGGNVAGAVSYTIPAGSQISVVVGGGGGGGGSYNNIAVELGGFGGGGASIYGPGPNGTSYPWISSGGGAAAEQAWGSWTAPGGQGGNGANGGSGTGQSTADAIFNGPAPDDPINSMGTDFGCYCGSAGGGGGGYGAGGGGGGTYILAVGNGGGLSGNGGDNGQPGQDGSVSSLNGTTLAGGIGGSTGNGIGGNGGEATMFSGGSTNYFSSGGSGVYATVGVTIGGGGGNGGAATINYTASTCFMQ